MQINKFRKNFARAKNAWIPRQSKRTVGGKPKGPNATEAKYLREVLIPLSKKYGTEITYQPPPIVITDTTKREYTADFLENDKDGHLVYHEVKGSYHLPTHERARLAWEIAAEKNPDCIFVWSELTKKGWEIEMWVLGGKKIAVCAAGENEMKYVNADWRRHKPRKGKR